MRGLILAAGLGERLRPLTLTRAKPAIEFLNVPMLTFPYFWLNTLGLTDLVLNTHHLPDTIRHAAMHVVDPSIALHLTHEPIILGSGGGIANAGVYLVGEKTFAVANGDAVVVGADLNMLTRMRAFHEAEGALATLLVCPLEGVGTRIPGVWLESGGGKVANFGKEASRAGLECLHFASFMLFDQRIWEHLPEGHTNILYDILEPRIAAGDKVCAYRDDTLNWFETGNVADYLRATQACLEYMRDPAHQSGAMLRRLLERHAPPCGERSDISALRLIADSAVLGDININNNLNINENINTNIDININGLCVIGANARVEDGVRLDNCVVLPAARVVAGTSHAREVIISS